MNAETVFDLQSLTHVRLTCSIMCLTFLCWLFSMSSRWWIFSLRIATSFSNCSALQVHKESYHTLPCFDCYWLIKNHLICLCVCVSWPLIPFLALLSHLAQLAELLLTVADRLPQGGALLLHPSQQPLELFYAFVFPLAGFFCGLQLLLLFAQVFPQPAAFSLEKKTREKEGMVYYFWFIVMICDEYKNKLSVCLLPAASLSPLGVSFLLPGAVHISACWPPSACFSLPLHLLPNMKRKCQVSWLSLRCSEVAEPESRLSYPVKNVWLDLKTTKSREKLLWPDVQSW